MALSDGVHACAHGGHQAVQLLAGSGAVQGLGKLHSNLAAAFLQLERPHAAVAACHRAIEVSALHLLNIRFIPLSSRTLLFWPRPAAPPWGWWMPCQGS